jgi:hypothetical protein
LAGLAELAARVPIRDFIDHGPNVQPAAAADEFLQKTYPNLYAKATHASSPCLGARLRSPV